MSRDKIRFPKLVSNGTQSRIIEIVRDFAPVSRSGIVDKANLPHAAVSREVANLLKNKVVTESALADTNGPRRKRGLRLNGECGYVMSVEYGPVGLEGVVFDTAYNVISTKEKKIALAQMTQNEKIKNIISFIETLVPKATNSTTNSIGLAVIDPGAIDPEAGVCLMATTMDDWNKVPIAEILEGHFRLPVMLLNTSMAKIRAVDRLEINCAVENLIYIEYGQGVGCGLKLQGSYISGESNLAGELGHVRITDKQTPCRCGGVGCLESVAALPALARNVTESLEDNSSSTLAQLENIDGLKVLAAAAEGDRLASHIVDEAFDYLGRAVAGIVNIVNPQIVLFDSVISLAGDEAVATLMRSLSKNVLSSHAELLDARISKLTCQTGALGGAVAVLNYCFGY